MKVFDDVTLGWKPFFQEQLDREATNDCFPGRISLIHRSHCVVWSAKGEHLADIKSFHEPKNLAVGDWVLLPNEGDKRIRLLERQNELSRKAAARKADTQLMAANVDTLFIVSACDRDFAESRIERYLALSAEIDIKPIIVLTKADLADDVEPFKRSACALQHGISVECVDARNAEHLTTLKSLCGIGQTVALVGASGVGKSTLINTLADAGQRTCEVSGFDGKGRHTTTARSLHLLHNGGVLIDTPGMRELELGVCEKGIETVFADVSSHLGRCKFANCSHQNEPGCVMRAAIDAGELDIERWRRYQTLQHEQILFKQAVARKLLKGRRRGRQHK
jgi:ribosome biogenesis GTPase